ncbi:hypothetical protein COT42_06960 [Candidatus Saganbacteria bacterium CG08_land_8_20_14_0_20_45_16]|uniref:Trigger factor n=1 Tax=Candidatus Saganbacteria bacterium CG08_land_8_20_14_0_20_45_16 TaxID=2014293 RepID=A0A2H0XV30_UNCSA|nr:MAG: hypothetical protein COT42_06960 [Candidatus Saganbacteria bacterium CG08_land_8_20_14_0_20_45_16]
MYNKITMQIKSQDREKNTVTIEVESPHADFVKAREKVLAKAGKEIKIQGFRPGKAPKDMVERALNPEYLDNEAAQSLIADLYPEIIKETKIEPVDYPNVEIVEQKAGVPFVFKVKVDVYPEIKLGKYKGLKEEKIKVSVSDDDVIKVLGNLQKRFSTKKEDGTTAELPLDDEFAKKVSRHGTLAELKKEVHEGMLLDRQGRAEADVKDKLVAVVSAGAEVDIPKGMVDREIEVMIDEFRANLAQSGLGFEDYLKAIKKEEKTMREELRKSAQLRVKGKTVLREIAKVEEIKLTPEDIEAEFKVIAASSGEPIEELRARLKAGAQEYIEDYLYRRKALDFVLENAKITEIEPKTEEEKK